MEDVYERAKSILSKINIQAKTNEKNKLEKESLDPNFWKDSRLAAKKMQRLAKIQSELDDLANLENAISEQNEHETSSLVKKLEAHLYLSGKYDNHNAILTIQAGQGGVDAMDFAAMLFRMYTRYFEKKGFDFEVTEYSSGEEAGIKSATILVGGESAYGYLKGEQGVHRLVRLSPFNSAGLRHTSFARVEVIPQIDQDDTIDINDDDLEWDFYRASSHGGQNVQKVSSAVRLTHKPSGIVVTCQTERHQAQNREYALKMLKSKLWAKKEEEMRKKEESLKGDYVAPSWGNAIRSYVLHPYQVVKDARTNIELSNVEKVLDGDIEEFISASIKEKA